MSDFKQVLEMYREFFGHYVKTDADKDFYNQLWNASTYCALFYMDEEYLKGFKYSKEETTVDDFADKLHAARSPIRPMKPYGNYQPVNRTVFTSGNQEYVLHTYYNHQLDWLFLRVFYAEPISS